MAYMDFFNSSSFNPMAGAMDMFGSPIAESEEERRRREEAERLRLQEEADRQRQAMIAGPIAPAAPDQQYETQGLQEGPAGQAMAGFRQPSTTPFKQTLTIDPATGQQKMKMEGDPRDFTAANPFTPTIAGPMAPGTLGPSQEELLREQEQRRLYDMMMAQQPPAGPTAPAAAGVQMAAAPATTQTDVTAGVTGPVPPAGMAINPETGEFYTPVPGMAAAQPAAQPAAAAVPVAPPSPDRQYIEQDITEGPVFQQLAAEPTAAGFNFFNIIRAAQKDPAAMERIARDPNTPEQWRRVAADQSRMTLEQKRERERAEAEARRIISTGDTSLARKVARREGDEGSELKLALYEFLFGANSNLAKLEARKLDLTWEQSQDEQGNPVLIQRRGDGKVMQGIGADQQPMTDRELTKYAGGGVGKVKPDVGIAGVQKTMPDGTVIKGRVVTTYDAQNRPKTQVESGGKFYAYTGDWKDISISTAAEKAVAQKQINLAYDPIIKAATTSADELTKANIKYGTNFAIAGTDRQGQPILVDQNTNQVVRPDEQGVVSVTTTAAPAGARGAGVPVGGTRGLEARAQISETAGVEAVKSAEQMSVKAADTADAASQTAAVARRIRTSIDQNPQVVGMLTKTNDKGQNIVTATLAAVDAGLGGSDAIEAAVKQMKFSTSEQAVYEQIKGDLTELALARARENKGQGTFTDFERRLFAQTTGDIARNQGRALQYRMEIFEYAADKANRKSEFIENFRAQNPSATVGQINAAWRRHNRPFDEAFEQRMNETYIKPKYKVIR